MLFGKVLPGLFGGGVLHHLVSPTSQFQASTLQDIPQLLDPNNVNCPAPTFSTWVVSLTWYTNTHHVDLCCVCAGSIVCSQALVKKDPSAPSQSLSSCVKHIWGHSPSTPSPMHSQVSGFAADIYIYIYIIHTLTPHQENPALTFTLSGVLICYIMEVRRAIIIKLARCILYGS